MKGNQKIIDQLNARLANEFAAIHQYILHAAMCSNWGYDLDETIMKRAQDEMRHSDMLLDRILFLEGTPIVDKLDPINIGAFIPAMMDNDHTAEMGAIAGYNETIRLAAELGDNNTRTILESILHDEESHINWIEEQIVEILQIGLQNYLAEKI